MLGLALQHLLGQVVDDVTIIPREAGDEAGHVVSPLHRQRRQLERGDPPLGASLQRGHVPRRQLQAHHLVEVRRGLIGREAQLGRAGLDQLATRSQSCQRQRGIGPAGDHHVQPRRQMVEQERHPVLHIERVDDVVVVEHQHDVAREGAQVVEQLGQHRFDRRRLGRMQQGQRTLADPGCHRPQRRDHIGPEGCGIVVAPIERQPRGQPLIGRRGRSRRKPLGEQRRLAEASRCGDEHQLRRGPAVQPLAQPRTRHQTTPRPRDIQLRLEQRGWHQRIS